MSAYGPEGDAGEEIVPVDWPTYYTPVPVWVLLSGCSAQAYRLYAFLAEHINNREPGRRIAFPKQIACARVMGIASDRKVAKYRQELEGLGAITVEEYRYGGGMRRGYRYLVRFNPPRDYAGLLSLGQFYDANPDVRSAGARGRGKEALAADGKPNTSVADSPSTPSPGSRAPGKKAPKTRERISEAPTLPPEVLKVLGAFPGPLREAMRETAHTDTPKTLVTAAAHALKDRSMEQLIDRVNRRWGSHGYETKFAAGELKRPVGAAVAMLRHGECPDAQCEDGTVLGTGQPCRLCIERSKDYKADAAAARKADREAKAAAARAHSCPSCERDLGTEGALCPACVARFEQDIREAALRARRAAMEARADDAGDAHERVMVAAQEARERARAKGASSLGEFLAARMAAEDAARVWQGRLEASAASAGGTAAPEIPIPAQPPAQEVEWAECGGSRGDGSSCGRPTDAADGLCGLCRATQRLEGGAMAAAG